MSLNLILVPILICYGLEPHDDVSAAPGAAAPLAVHHVGDCVSSIDQRNTLMTEVLCERWRATCDSGRGAA